MTEEQHMASIVQRTLKTCIPYVGTGLHSGCRIGMLVRPSEVNTGVRFLRNDVPTGRGVIPALWHQVVDTRLGTIIGNEFGISVSTVEHLMAALHGCGIDNAVVELDGPEVPILDGSAEPFVAMIERAGIIDQEAKRWAMLVEETVEVRLDDKVVRLEPCPITRITAEIDFPDTAVGTQRLSTVMTEPVFKRDLARARTFGFADQIEDLYERELALGGSPQNAILIDGDVVVNEEGLRFHDEFVRHKILDIIGDLSLAGVPVIGHFYGYKPGHALNQALLRKFISNEHAWSYVMLDEYENAPGLRRLSDALATTATRVKKAWSRLRVVA
ncbi:MAG: UDP-3-O-acyl-N-acetylglucosamine deacetylase [Gammaproteobacteria bacterium]|jgi:UDP-3-O-[3-hydroxymyristoyl] N-acetylglucosamine deacetylase|nr:UDP-3-O-acyl-N-acetylglucosamine deacetylase [Gammaproteobacteria bacterium]